MANNNKKLQINTKRDVVNISEINGLIATGGFKNAINILKNSDIENFTIDEQIDLNLKLYRLQSIKEFEAADIRKAIKYIEEAISIKVTELNQLFYAYYLSYLEHFEKVNKVTTSLINSKNTTISKTAIFLSLLADIYQNKFDINSVLLDKLNSAKKEYLLSFYSLKNNDLKEALNYLKNMNLKLTKEKANVKALISIIENSEFIPSKTEPSKTFYKALLGLSLNLENFINSKSVRVLKSEYQTYLEHSNKTKMFNNFLNLKESLHFDKLKLLMQNTPSDMRAFLIYNNIVLLLNENKFDTILEFFKMYKKELLTIPESIFVLNKVAKNMSKLLIMIDIEDEYDLEYIRAIEHKVTTIMLQFSKEYLSLYINKLQSFQIDVIFNSFSIFFKAFENAHLKLFTKNFTSFAKSFNFNPIFLQTNKFFTEIQTESETKLENDLKEILTNNSFNNMEMIETEMIAFCLAMRSGYLNKNLDIELKKQIPIVIVKTVNIFFNTKAKYKNFVKLLNMLDLLTSIVLKFNFTKHKDTYQKLLETSKFYLEYFNSKLENYKNLTLLSEIIENSTNSIEELKQNYTKEIENKKDGLNIIKKLKQSIYYVDFLNIYIEIAGFNENYIIKYINSINFYAQERNKFVSDFRVSNIKNTKLINQFYKAILPTYQINTGWYLEWCLDYLIFVCENNISKDVFIKDIYNFAIKLQANRKFKAQEAKYKKMTKIWKDN